MEQLFGLTAGAAKVVNEMAAKHRDRLPDVGRRTRRVYPLQGGNVALFLISDDDTVVYGARDGGGVAQTADAYRMRRFNSETDTPTYDSEAEEIDFRRNKGIHFNGNHVECLRVGDHWFATETGQTCWNEAVTAGVIAAISTGNVALISGGPQVDCKGPLTGSAVPSGVSVSVQWDYKTLTFLINGLGCPA